MSSSESVGQQFDPKLLERARDRTLEIIEKAAAQIRPGMTEVDGKKIVQQTATELGCEKFWHASQIRFGVNTLKGFGEAAEPGVVLKENDIFFFDVGGVFDGHEGDVARPFVLGTDPEMIKVARDARAVWLEVRDRWKNTQETGAQLYRFAEAAAAARGWQLSLYEASGHRISDFPHAAQARGSVDGLDFHPASNRWILEIQIRHPSKPFGAFFEDLLS